MKICRSLDLFVADNNPIALAIGFFDGIHRGHQKVLQELVGCAQSLPRGSSWVLSFDPHPTRMLRPDLAPSLISTEEQREYLLNRLGLGGWIIHPFTLSFSRSTPEEFVEYLTRRIPFLKHVFVGPNWHFGYQAKGTPELFAKLAARHQIQTHISDPIEMEGQCISSSAIREVVKEGKPEIAARMLGRPYSLIGPVIHGRKKGRSLGFPTANILVRNELLPASGIYAVFAKRDGDLLRGAGYFKQSIKKTGSDDTIFETHFFEPPGDLYGKEMEMHLVKRIRSDRDFNTDQELSVQIAKDVEVCRQVIEEFVGGS